MKSQEAALLQHYVTSFVNRITWATHTWDGGGEGGGDPVNFLTNWASDSPSRPLQPLKKKIVSGTAQSGRLAWATHSQWADGGRGWEK